MTDKKQIDFFIPSFLKDAARKNRTGRQQIIQILVKTCLAKSISFVQWVEPQIYRYSSFPQSWSCLQTVTLLRTKIMI